MVAYPNFYIVGEAWVETVAHESYGQEKLHGEGGEYNSYAPNEAHFQVCSALQNVFKDPFGWDED